jgi:hypothetical protein
MIRWWKFNLVGVPGVVVQSAVLWRRVPELLATVLAVGDRLTAQFRVARALDVQSINSKISAIQMAGRHLRKGGPIPSSVIQADYRRLPTGQGYLYANSESLTWNDGKSKREILTATHVSEQSGSRRTRTSLLSESEWSEMVKPN